MIATTDQTFQGSVSSEYVLNASGWTLRSSEARPLLLSPSVASHIVSFHGPDGELARVNRDGTVTLARPDAADEAARVFWKAIEVQGVGIVAHLRDLERRLAAHEAVERYPL